MSALQVAKKIRHFGRAPVEGICKFASQDAVAVDDVGFWNLDGPVEVLDLRAGIADGYKIHAVLADEPVISAVVLIRADGHHHNAFVFHALLHFHQRRRLRHAGRTPTRPEVQHDHLALELAQRYFVFSVLDHKIRGGFADPWRTRATIAARQKKKTHDAKGKDDPSHVDIIIDSAYGNASTSLEAAFRVGDRAGPERRGQPARLPRVPARASRNRV